MRSIRVLRRNGVSAMNVSSPKSKFPQIAAKQVPETISALDNAVRRLMWRERVWLKQALRADELEIAPFIVLAHLAHLGGVTTIGALAKDLDQRNTTMTGHIDRLEDKKFVIRKFGGAHDRRQVSVQLTTAGEEFLRRINLARREHIRQAAAHMKVSQVKELVSLLELYLSWAENPK